MVSRTLMASMVVVLIVVGSATVFLIGRQTVGPSTTSSSTKSASTDTVRPGFAKGFVFPPVANNATVIDDFFSKASQGASVVEWAGDWEGLGGSSPSEVARLVTQHGQRLMVVVQFFSQADGHLFRPLNSSNVQHYLSVSASFASEYKPAYFGIGVEVNILYEKNQSAFGEFLSVYSQAYDAVKAASPETSVFTTFQLEKMEGMSGGLYGGTNDPNKTEWQLLSDFPKDDVLAFTTYPSLVFHSPSDLPVDYYGAISQHSNKTIGFTEVGWHTGPAPGGWNGSESSQSEFVSLFLHQARTANAAFGVWSFLYDPAVQVPFNTMGLFAGNGTQKSGWPAWEAG